MSIWRDIATGVADHTGEPFQAEEPHGLAGGCINSAFKLSDGRRTYFVKTNRAALLEMFEGLSREPLMVQRYIPEVREGDKRIILVDGEPAGVLLRVPQAGEARSNLHVGGKGVKAALSERDWEICAAIGPTLREKGLVFVGIDVIGPYLTEINVTSPTGIQEIGRFDGTCIEALIWDAIERRIAAAKK